MKILYVYNFKYPDYQADTIYHGLIDSGFEVYETHYPSYMIKNSSDLSKLYGKGFSMFGKLDHVPNVESPEIIVEKICSKFYDIIIYGCVYTHERFPNRNCLDYLDSVGKYYSKDKVHFIDGSDNSWNYSHALKLFPYGTIWKSQLENISAGNPISFGIPESQLIKHTPKKEKVFADIIPGKKETYVYSTEESYYNDYAISYYGITWKKSQWNCMRHLEILANKCVPYFPDIDECPPFVMIDYPKEIFREVNKYARRGEIHPEYNSINEYLFSYLKNNLTTKQIVKKIINY